ncbi:regulation of enolase 1 [Streptomyces sp. 150FB]|nr:regulation of enolase 1 [Streptomyces sp. 150FB]
MELPELPEVPELPFGLRSYGPDGGWVYEDGSLTGQAGAGQDRFVSPAADSAEPASDAPRLLGTPEGDFQLIARVTADLAAPGDAGALALEVAERKWAKLCLELSPDRPTICTVVTRDHSDDANAFVVDVPSHWLRISRTGKAFAFHASPDGERWTFVRVFTLGTAEEATSACVGFLAQSPKGEGCGARFEGIAFRGYGVGELRDGS